MYEVYDDSITHYMHKTLKAEGKSRKAMDAFSGAEGPPAAAAVRRLCKRLRDLCVKYVV